jgi:hypothetical protein
MVLTARSTLTKSPRGIALNPSFLGGTVVSTISIITISSLRITDGALEEMSLTAGVATFEDKISETIRVKLRRLRILAERSPTLHDVRQSRPNQPDPHQPRCHHRPSRPSCGLYHSPE